jgi:hypothetical protein
MADQTSITMLRAMAEQVAQGCQCDTAPTCDTLQCLCRPRFFAGQLLTDEDLTNLEKYIVAKDRLHNKHLHGTGVVCGLEVVCNPCGEGVLVKEGYALGPCGEDIVVCQDTKVSIADLIHQCRVDESRNAPCNSRYPAGPMDCETAQQEWILSICYCESPSRGVTPLRNSKSSSSCGCGCGSSNGSSKSTSGCGCGGSTNTSTKNGSAATSCSCKSSRTTSAQCEPTLICEGFKFVLTKPMANHTNTDQPASDWTSQSEIVKQFIACVSKLMSSIRLPAESSKVDFQMLEAELLQFARGRCFGTADLRETSVRPGSLFVQRSSIFGLLLEVGRECLCSAILPPCSTGTSCDCVPLATLIVDTKSSRVLDICNLKGRKFLLTFPNLSYWLDWLHPFATLRSKLEAFCCGSTATEQMPPDPSKPPALTNVGRSLREVSGAKEENAVSPNADFDRILLSLLGLDQGGKDAASPDELLHPFSTVAVSSFLAPAIMETFKMMSAGSQASALGTTVDANADELRKLRAEFAVLKRSMKDLQGVAPKKTKRSK